MNALTVMSINNLPLYCQKNSYHPHHHQVAVTAWIFNFRIYKKLGNLKIESAEF